MKNLLFILASICMLLGFSSCEEAPAPPTVIPVGSISLDKTSLSLDVGGSYTLIPTVMPDNATNKTVTWASGNTSVATVDANGKVIAVAEGTAMITAKAGDKTATCAVTVTQPAAGVTLNKTATTLTVGETEQLTATVSPSNATNKNVTWSSDNTNVATVSSAGLITAVTVGTATIIVTTQDGNKTASCVVTVTQPVTDVSLNKNATTLTVGATEQLTATVLPSNATNKNVTWSSSHPSIATVSANGLVTARASGTAAITVATADGNKIASCMVNVAGKTSDTGVVINGVRWATCNVALPGTFSANPEDAGMFYQWNRKVGWSATNPLINSNGSTTWDSSIPAGTTWEKANDPCPPGWRMPSRDELIALVTSGNVWTNVNGMNGCRFGSGSNTVFLPAAGYRYSSDGTLGSAGSYGYYWSSTQSLSSVAYNLYFYSGIGWSARSDWNKAGGLSCRCVAE